MQTPLVMVLPVAALWLAAGVLADRLPGPGRAAALRRRTDWLLALSLTALGTMVAIMLTGLGTVGATSADQATAALIVPAAPAGVVALLTVRRVRRLRASAGAFVSAPATPAPPSLRAGAAHPMIGLPIQVTGLVCVSALVVATRPELSPTAGLSGPALSLLALGILAIGVRHALRHSRLTEPAVATGRVSPPAAGALHV